MAIDFELLNKLLLACAICGVLFGAMCDVIRAFRMIIPRGFLLVAVGDVLFCLICTCVLILCFYNYSFGHMRMFGFAAAGITFAVWELTVGRLTSRIVEKLQAFISPKLKKLYAELKFTIAFLCRRVYTVYTARHLRRSAANGFGLYKGGNVNNVPQN